MSRSATRGIAFAGVLVGGLLDRPHHPPAGVVGQLHVRVGNRSVVVGKARCLEELERLFDRVTMFGRDFHALWSSADGATVLIETDLVPAGSFATLTLAWVARWMGRNWTRGRSDFISIPRRWAYDQAAREIAASLRWGPGRALIEK